MVFVMFDKINGLVSKLFTLVVHIRTCTFIDLYALP